MRYLSNKDLTDLVPPTALVAAIEQALSDFAKNKVIVPTRGHIDFEGNTLLTMPVMGKRAVGAKIVSVVPSNAARGLPVTNGLMTLSDGETGVPLAVLNGAALTAQRTGAVGAVGLKYAVPLHSDAIGIIGTGVQGTWQAIFACAVRRTSALYFLARSDEKAQRFVDTVSRHVPWVRLSRCKDVRQLLAHAQAVITATTSSTPVLPNERRLLENKHFISIGSFKPSMQELPNSVYELAQHVVVDSEAATSEVGDVIKPLSLGLLQKENVIHLADLVVDKRSVDI